MSLISLRPGKSALHAYRFVPVPPFDASFQKYSSRSTRWNPKSTWAGLRQKLSDQCPRGCGNISDSCLNQNPKTKEAYISWIFTFGILRVRTQGSPKHTSVRFFVMLRICVYQSYRMVRVPDCRTKSAALSDFTETSTTELFLPNCCGLAMSLQKGRVQDQRRVLLYCSHLTNCHVSLFANSILIEGRNFYPTESQRQKFANCYLITYDRHFKSPLCQLQL